MEKLNIETKSKYKLTQSDMVLISMYRVSNGSKEKIPYEEIAISAWKDFPDSFSLKNHPEYPDGSAIPKRVNDRLRPQGLVISLGESFFRLTNKGVEKARKLDNAIRGISKKRGQTYRRLSRDEENFVRHAFTTTAFDLWMNRKKESIIDHDVKLFFQFSTGTKISDRIYKVRFAKTSIEKAKKIGAPNIHELENLAEFLTIAFGLLIGEGKNVKAK
ncbi:MAG TPA: hypothetical protein G4N92_07655 [Anaerolineae bacterium]|nr:hypothetical protein [Anaerolineae bacterium]